MKLKDSRKGFEIKTIRLDVEAGCNSHNGKSFVPIDQALTTKLKQEEIEE